MPDPFPTFTAADTALVLVDHQVGTMKLIRNIPADTALRNALALAKAAAVLGLPVVLTTSQEDRVQGPLAPELAALLPEAFAARVKRGGIVNAWDDPAFRGAVERTGRKNLAVAGVTTDVCLVFPTVSATRAGYRVQAVMDASGSPFELSEETSRQRMRDGGVVLTATNTLIAELAVDWSLPAGAKLIQLLFTDVLPSLD